jgi:hypothetical protein
LAILNISFPPVALFRRPIHSRAWSRVLIEPKSYSPTRASCCPVQRSKCDGGGDDLDIITDETWLSIRGIRVNGYGTGTINQIYRPLGLGIIRPDKNSVAFVIFTATAYTADWKAFKD